MQATARCLSSNFKPIEVTLIIQSRQELEHLSSIHTSATKDALQGDNCSKEDDDFLNLMVIAVGNAVQGIL